ncbi:MAG: hypothetical protein EXS37_13980 [Opitutus sp.]|nr:hypothetical protein [Opitutus sp.]
MLRLLVCRHPFAALVIAFTFFSSPEVRAQDDPASRRAAIEGMYPVMLRELEAKNFGRARNLCDQAIIWEPQNPVHHYNLACIEAQTGGARMSHAIVALEMAAVLGFNDPSHLMSDPDLAPLRNDPKFAGLAQKIADNAIRSTTGFLPTPPATRPAPGNSRPTMPADPSPKTAAEPSAPPETPAPPAFRDGVPVGLYFMSRYWSFTSTLEKAAWYFAPDGAVYQNLEHGFSRADLTAHRGPRGTAKTADKKLAITWNDGKETSDEIEREGAGFIWERGIFTSVRAFGHAADVAGIYEGGESLAVGGVRAIVSKRLELRADGTFTWDGVALVGNTMQPSQLSSGKDASTGRWQLNGYSLILTDSSGAVLRRIAFPDDDEKTPVKPDRMFFGGMIFKRRP